MPWQECEHFRCQHYQEIPKDLATDEFVLVGTQEQCANSCWRVQIPSFSDEDVFLPKKCVSLSLKPTEDLEEEIRIPGLRTTRYGANRSSVGNELRAQIDKLMRENEDLKHTLKTKDFEMLRECEELKHALEAKDSKIEELQSCLSMKQEIKTEPTELLAYDCLLFELNETNEKLNENERALQLKTNELNNFSEKLRNLEKNEFWNKALLS